MSKVRLALFLLLSVLCTPSSQLDCELPIRRDLVLNAWQSSFADGPTCFHDRSPAEEGSVVMNRKQSYKFFHSGGRSQADGGFHWFAVQLNESVLIRSVTVKGRDDGALENVYQRARDVEIWTSSSLKSPFSADHCSASNLSSQFNDSLQHWSWCGSTENSLSRAPAVGELLPVSCIAEVRYLLLRKSVTGADYMSFSAVLLHTVDLAISATQVVTQNSDLSVNCSLHCNNGANLVPKSSSLTLCQPNGRCSAAGRGLQIASAQPEHSGNYTCKFGNFARSTSVSVVCNFPIRRDLIYGSWQSSSYAQTCFHNRSTSTESKEIKSYRFFHSADRSQADTGFHWFAVQLKEPLLIRSVTVKSREVGSSSDFSRARGIEVYTSARQGSIFSGDHCHSRSMSKDFYEVGQWTLCGRTEKLGTVTSGEFFTLTCEAEVRHLLLRRADFVNDEQYMNFADLTLHTYPLRIVSPQLVAENTNFTVGCSFHCGGSEHTGANSTNIRLCFSNGSCTSERELMVLRAQPEHSGRLTCRFGALVISNTVTVLKSSPSQVVAEHSRFSVSCSLHCGVAGRCAEASAFGRLQLCQPNDTCTATSRLDLGAATAAQSGVYRCQIGSVEAQTHVTVLSITPHQVVAEGSNLTVSCNSHCKAHCSSFEKPQICMPNASCKDDVQVKIIGVTAEHSGSYSCRLQSARAASVVTVLTPSPSRVVAENSSFSVSCSLHCGAASWCSKPAAFNRLQLCAPNGSCTSGFRELKISAASPDHSGIYRCIVGPVVAPTRVTVLSSSPSQIVTENSSFTVSCSIHCGSTGHCSHSDQLLLCDPTGSCTAERQKLIVRAQTQNCGTYVCKLGFVQKSSAVFLLKSSPHQTIAEHSSLNLSCSVHCGGATECAESSAFGHLRLCQPNGSCTATSRLEVTAATPAQSGVYLCQLGSAAAQMRVAVLSLSPPQVVAEASSFTVKCWLHSGNFSSTEKPQLCAPTGSCSADSEFNVRRASRTDSGTYRCRHGSLEVQSIVSVLSTSANKIVAENSTLTVLCTLFSAGGLNRSTNSDDTQICSPSGRCTSGPELEISRAGFEHSGSYSCSFKAVRKLTTIILLKSSPSQVVAEHSRFSVSCSLHCGVAGRCAEASAFGRLQLCQPNDTCTATSRLDLGAATAAQSGVYRCQIGSVEAQTHVTVLSITPHQVVAEGSNLTVSCNSHCKAHCSSFEKPQICMPNASCKDDVQVKIIGVTAEHSGSYSCRLQSARAASVVTVLTSSRDQIVAVNSSFSVACSLYVNGTPMSLGKGELQVQACFPNGSCEFGQVLRIAKAGPELAGLYVCRFGSIEKSCSVTVLYPPENVSITFLNSHNCTSLTDLTVQLRSSACQPAPEHRCRADEGHGTGVRNLTCLSMTRTEQGAVSEWAVTTGEDEQSIDWRAGSVGCSVEQAGLTDNGYEFFIHRTAEWSCSIDSTIVTATKSASIVGLCALVMAALLMLLMIILKPRTARTSTAEVNLVDMQPSTCAAPVSSTDPAKAVLNEEPAHSYFRCNTPECTYMSVIPGPMAATDSPIDPHSDSTLFIEIVADRD